MAWTPPYYPTTLKEMFALNIKKLLVIVADHGRRLGLAAPLLFILCVRINTLAAKLASLAARGPGPAHRPRLRRRARAAPPSEKPIPKWLRAAWPTIRFGAPPPLPRGFGALRRLIQHPEITGYAMKIEALLTHPDMVALIETTPAAGRTLRPLCHLLGIQTPPNLALPERPDRPQNATPKPARARKPRARPEPVFPPITSTPPPLGPGNHYFIPNPKIFKNC
ncbi:hypothetical protein [Acidiphilium sp.]|uniref:hypothetical protein n=1 Tax=Acidiphilium sp. TaxID=527 RepID=UPI003D054826